MPDQPVNEIGRYVLKGDAPRYVRSVRLTDDAYDALLRIASERGETLSDYLHVISEIEAPSRGCWVPLIECKRLRDALALPANRGGAIKTAIREFLSHLPLPT
ncbi:MAG: hypothetical protein DDT26_02567 [Dehalococcoidia bacterium]|nr:hypothetical protein [Chloroflexota bacterium]MBT9166573.1 hypothetical protein [Chloroflexota bacterium]